MNATQVLAGVIMCCLATALLALALVMAASGDEPDLPIHTPGPDGNIEACWTESMDGLSQPTPCE